jgi:hypothetical protein
MKLAFEKGATTAESKDFLLKLMDALEKVSRTD